jgi:hypothetical protein
LLPTYVFSSIGISCRYSAAHVNPVTPTPLEMVLEAWTGFAETALLAATGTGGTRQISW